MLKILAKSVRQHKKQALFASFFMILEVIMEVLIPYWMADLIDDGINAGNMNVVLKIGLILVLFAVLSLMFGSLSGSFAAIASTGYAKNLRRDVFVSIQNFSFSNIDKFSEASLVTRLTTDVNNVMGAFQALIRQAVRAVFMASLALVMAFQVNGKVAIIFVFVAPVLAFGLFLIINKAHPHFVAGLRTYDKLNGVVSENLGGIRVVKSYVREEEEEKKFTAVSEEVYKQFTGGQKRVAFNMPLIQLCTYTCIIAISYFATKLIIVGDMSTGDLMSMFAYITQILFSLMLLSFVFVQIIIARSSAARIYEVLSEKPDISNPAEPIYNVRSGDIAFKSVDFSYVADENKLCLMDVNLDIRSGQTIGILGGTGSSKTTLVQLIARLYDVTRGAVFVGGVDVREYDIKALRDAVAIVLQKNVLFSGTVKENLRWGNENATNEQMRRACRLAAADSFVEAMKDGYDTMIEEGGANLSGGQRQRLCIARALLKNPKIIVLDDSTSAVDTKTDAVIRSTFKSELRGITKLIIAQRISSVIDADKIIIMDGGKIVAIGTHAELLKSSDVYREIYQIQTQSGGDFDE